MSRKFPFLMPLAAMSSSMFSVASAVDIAIVNPGFEDITGQVVVEEFTFGIPVGWVRYDPNVITGLGGVSLGTLRPNGVDFFNDPAPEGIRVSILFASDQLGAGEYGLEQTLTTVLEANTQYDLMVEVGNIASGNSISLGFFNLDGFPGYRVELRAGGQIIAQDDNTMAESIPEGEFRPAVVTAIIGQNHPQLGQALAVRVVNLNRIPVGFDAMTSPDLEVDFDLIQLVSTPLAPDSVLFADGFEG